MAANILATVTEASGRERKAHEALVAAIVEASAQGHSNREIAKACHLSHERVRQIVNAAKPQVDEAKLEARLAELDKRWDSFIGKLAERYMPIDQRAITAYRNNENKRAARQASGLTKSGKPSGASGWKSTRRPTVKVEAARLAETFALSYLEQNSAHPVCVKVLRELDEAAALREQLAAILNSRVPFLHD